MISRGELRFHYRVMVDCRQRCKRGSRSRRNPTPQTPSSLRHEIWNNETHSYQKYGERLTATVIAEPADFAPPEPPYTPPSPVLLLLAKDDEDPPCGGFRSGVTTILYEKYFIISSTSAATKKALTNCMKMKTPG